MESVPVQERYSLCEVPEWIVCDGKGFAPDCRIVLTAVAAAAGRSGRLRIHVWRQGALPLVSGASIHVESVAGNISVAIGGDDCSVDFGTQSSGAYDVRLWRGSRVTIGARTTSNGTRIVCDDSEFECAEDCMFSDGVLVQTADQHGIVDIATRQIVNAGRRRVVLETHVWLGRGSTIMPGARIGAGALIGTGAIVTGNVDPMCIAAGVPARIIKRGFTWCRSSISVDDQTMRLIDTWNDATRDG